jgi:hypothetical protein
MRTVQTEQITAVYSRYVPETKIARIDVFQADQGDIAVAAGPTMSTLDDRSVFEAIAYHRRS